MSDLDNLLAQVEPLRDEIVSFHQDIVRIATVNTGVMPTGNETPCAEYLQRRLAAEGIESEILESAPTRGNLIARLKGEGGGPTLMFMTHLDVVPIEDESTWTYPPFSAMLADGKIWGRGSDDCKAVTTAAFFATTLLKKSGLARKGDLIYTGTADEESGGFYGFKWLAEHHPEKITADFAINEGGSGPMPSREGVIYGLPTGEKGRVEVTITITGRSGHASRPWAADNALEKAGRVLTALSAYQPEIDLSHPIFDHLGEMIEGLERPTPETLEDCLATVAKKSRAGGSPDARPDPDDAHADHPARRRQVEQHPGHGDHHLRRSLAPRAGRAVREERGREDRRRASTASLWMWRSGPPPASRRSAPRSPTRSNARWRLPPTARTFD